MTTKISKCTVKGQITLPKDWRGQFKTDTFMIKYEKKELTITPVDLADLRGEVIFDAERDNEGKGISVDEMINTLKKIKNG